MNNKSKIIFKPAIARQLLKLGYRIIDIKANRNDESGKMTAFVFERTGNFDKDLQSIVLSAEVLGKKEI